MCLLFAFILEQYLIIMVVNNQQQQISVLTYLKINLFQML